MTMTPNPAQPLKQPADAAIIAGPWPDFTAFRHPPERDRWRAYECAKRQRANLEAQGFQMSERYDAFVRRVCAELDL